LYRLLNTRQFTSHRTRWEKFVIEVNAASKRPLQNNKLGTSWEQAGRGAHMVHQIKAPGAMIRPGAIREFQFPEYTDLAATSITPCVNTSPRGSGRKSHLGDRSSQQ
jgi:hypothetical protein